MTDGASVLTAVASKTAPSLIGVRQSVSSLTADEVTALRSGITGMLAIADDRGYEHWAGIHGLPLPMHCQHGSPLFLPWHRAYLYFFEQYLLNQETTVRLPWWDWADDQAIPPAYDQAQLPDGSANPLAAAPVSGIPADQFTEENVPEVAMTYRQPDPNSTLPGPDDVAQVLALDDFMDFTGQLEQQLHNRVHMWVGGTMGLIPLAAYDPIFWAHHCMIDRLWAIWQQSHPGADVGTVPLDTPLSPFPSLNVGGTLDINGLGYSYAVSSSSAAP